MDNEQQRRREIEQAIARGRAVVKEAREALERSRHQFKELGIDPEKEHDRLRAEGGDEALANAQEQCRAYIEEIEAEVRCHRMHSQAPGGAGRLVRFRPNKV